MKSLTKSFAMAAVFASGMALSAPAAAQNIVTNGDFSGGLSSWTVAPGPEIGTNPGFGYSGC